jgi:proton-dependent oligopeptide transporter, POT family
MERILDNIEGQSSDLDRTHNKETLLFGVSKAMERASYYGLRSLIVLYMVSEVINMETNVALSIYGWFTFSIFFSAILGGVIGDLILGNKKTIIIGGIIQSAGAFILSIPSLYTLYIGIALITLGGGLFNPNIASNFGKSYLNKSKLLDSGFSIFYLATNVGAALGVIVIGYSGEKYDWSIGFIAAGILMILSIIPILFTNKEYVFTKKTELRKNDTILINIILCIFLVSLFWGIYGISSIRIIDIQNELSTLSALPISKTIITSINPMLIIPLSILMIILWTLYYSTQFKKLVIGYLFGTASYIILYLIPSEVNEQSIYLYLLAILFFSISEVYLAPVVQSIVTQYANPNYLAIIMSLVFIPNRILAFLIGLFNEQLYNSPINAIQIATILMVVISFALVIFLFFNRNTTYNNRYTPMPAEPSAQS